ncbi:hypothetical protein FBU30_001441 [Linnemannia zychae]|nr:hypothetical protein FBU30_001441 [Linnemannia zychae]
MSVSGVEWQEFTSGEGDTLEIRVFPGTEKTQGRSFILYEDIQDMFPGITRLLYGKRMVGMMADAEGNRLHPLRIEYHPGCTISVITKSDTLTSSLQAGPQSTFSSYSDMPLCSASESSYIDPHSSKSSTSSTDVNSPTRTSISSTISSIISKKSGEILRRASVLDAPNISAEVKLEFKSSLDLYHNFLQAIRNGQTEDTNSIRDDFRQHFMALEDEMAKNAELQQQMLEMQQNMMQLQQQSLDRLALIQSRAQAILVQNYELHEYPIPRLFIVLPKDSSRWNPTRAIHNKFRLYFLCECGDHTKFGMLNNNNNPHHIHLAKHEGYDIEMPTEFFQKYGSYIFDVLNMIKYGAMVAGLTVPALVPLRVTATVDQLKDTLNHLTYNIGPSINQAITYLQSLSNIKKSCESDGRKHRHIDGLEALEGADLRQLGMFLKRKDSLETLGNLYRIVTSEGHVKWVCLDHYRSSYSTAAMKELVDLIQVNGGSFEEHIGRVEISLSSSIIAEQFFQAMARGRFIQELKVALTWETTISDLKKLREAVHQSNISYLDLSCTAVSSTISMLRIVKAANPLWELMTNAKLYTFILSKYNGFFSNTSFTARTTELRKFKITDQVDWKKDGSKVLELIKHSPMLQDLYIECSDLGDAYMAIKNQLGSASNIEKLLIRSGNLNQISVQYGKGLPNIIDLWVSNPASPLLADITNLRKLQIRTAIHLSVSTHLSYITNVIIRNTNLCELWVRCQVSEMCEVFQTIRAVIATMGTMTSLKSLRIYRDQIQLFSTNLHDINAVNLEIMSSESNTTLLQSLLKNYGNHLTKFKIESSTLHRPFWNSLAIDTLLFHNDVSRIQCIELEASSLTNALAHSLLVLFNHPSFPTTKNEARVPAQVSIKVNIVWQKSKLCDFIVKFITDAAPWLTTMMFNAKDIENYKSALSLNKIVLQKNVIKICNDYDQRLFHTANLMFASYMKE